MGRLMRRNVWDSHVVTFGIVLPIKAYTPDYKGMTVPALRALCKARGVKGYSKLNKAALVSILATVALVA